MATNSPTMTTLHKFQELPTELQLKIWSHALDLQRIVADEYFQAFERPYGKKVIKSDTPVLLHICQESRDLALTKYGSVFKPTDGEAKHMYIGSYRRQHLRNLLDLLGLSKSPKGCLNDLGEMQPVLDIYLEVHVPNC